MFSAPDSLADGTCGFSRRSISFFLNCCWSGTANFFHSFKALFLNSSL
ncbi:Uncharacterised protein [Vibrio cholerae]|nr:Uncharacterised protein [Vibrio cholerae]